MAAPVNIQSFSRVIPMIYAYNTPGVSYHDGWTKIGYTEKQSVQQRIRQQTHTADIHYEIAWMDNAMYKDGSGEYFTDREFHNFLVKEKQVRREPNTEWFHVDAARSQSYFNEFSRRSTAKPYTGSTYDLRTEQKRAVAVTRAYFETGGAEFLWNAKPRFGKTLAAYHMICEMHFQNVLIVTNRPSIANSWADDFRKFIGWQYPLCFVSETDALKGKPGVMTREEYIAAIRPLHDDERKGMVAFESLQGLKGSVYFGGDYHKLDWMAKEYTDGFGQKQHGICFDLLIVDEAQEGVDTLRTDRAFRNIDRKHTLYLSGTPFKALASEQFAENQIFNWSYADEQEAKARWDNADYNPYEALPRLSMFTYQLSNMIYDEIQKGIDLSDEKHVDYAFDLNEFFATNETGKFIHEGEIKKFLSALATQEKYPFSTPELRQELSHTLWLLNRVASVKALAKLLKADPVFCEYEIILAAGDGKLDGDEATQEAYDRVKTAIAAHEKTITLSVGQLTVGVTIPEWSGVLMLCNMQSPSSYMQAAFRAQNPCSVTKDGQRYRKETAYVFDFDPARTLIIFDEFANNLSPTTAAGHGTSDERKENIRRLLNFFPVLGEDSEGTMVELDAAQVLSIPRRLKSQEVVRRGFMSNFLFQNISNVFGAPGIVREIIEKLTPAHEEPKRRDKEVLEHMEDVPVNDSGEVQIPGKIVIGRTQDLFGQKFYDTAVKSMEPHISAIAAGGTFAQKDAQVRKIVDTMKETIRQKVVEPVSNAYDIKKGAQERLKTQLDREIEKKFEEVHGDYIQQTNIAKVEHEKRCQSAQTEAEVAAADTSFKSAMEDALSSFTQSVQEVVQQTIKEKPKELVEQAEKNKAETEKKTIEDTIRDHLRGFSRTIPSFIMAYGDGKLTLANIDEYTEDEVFLEVTGITEEQFRFLRDGGDYPDPNTGETQHFHGHLFDEVVFNDSVNEFWNKKTQLADYFDETQKEDIFDYIPPQRTNQIFTPKWVVAKMVDELEANNPGCFDDPTKKFADLYMKSGLYITEIVKRLFRSEKMKSLYPDDTERVQHILREQVYGMAPTRIIYLIATNYILGFDAQLKSETKNFVQADAAAAAKDDRLAALVDECFGTL